MIVVLNGDNERINQKPHTGVGYLGVLYKVLHQLVQALNQLMVTMEIIIGFIILTIIHIMVVRQV